MGILYLHTYPGKNMHFIYQCSISATTALKFKKKQTKKPRRKMTIALSQNFKILPIHNQTSPT